MHISNAQIHKVLELHLHRVSGVHSPTGVNTAQQSDRLTLSRKATDMQDIKQLLARVPEMRVGVVNDFKNRVETGAYEVSELEVAENMMTSALLNRTVA
jgi:hypothetical protein